MKWLYLHTADFSHNIGLLQNPLLLLPVPWELLQLCGLTSTLSNVMCMVFRTAEVNPFTTPSSPQQLPNFISCEFLQMSWSHHMHYTRLIILCVPRALCSSSLSVCSISLVASFTVVLSMSMTVHAESE